MHEEESFQSVPRARMAPPVDAGTGFLRPKQPGWPKAIGVICIVVGALGVLMTILGIVSQSLMSKFIEMAPPEQVDELKRAIEAAEPWKPWTYTLSAISAALAVMLIVGGVRLTRRRASAAGLLQMYAVLRMGIVAAVGVITYKIQQSALAGNSDVPASAAQALAVGQSLFAIAWGWALPIFLLIWFARRRIKDEVRGWSEMVTNP